VPSSAQPVGTAFTYQGRLTDAGTPANGTFDLQLVLMDAAVGGSQVGPILTRDDVMVTSGLFTTPLDFGSVFTGSKRWLELAVRPGASTGAYTSLAPRQELTPSPNAVFSLTTPWAGIANKPAGFADDIDNDSGGDVTGVTAGLGLTGGAASGNATLNVSFGGSGTSNQVARANHDHIGNSWQGPGGLYLNNTDPGTPGFWNQGLWVEAVGNQTRAVLGYATPTTGQNIGVWGQSDSTTGFGVLGYAPSTSGVNYGVYGRSDSPTGYAGFFEGLQVGIPNGKLTFGSTARQLIDLNGPAYGIGVQGGVVYFRTEPPGGNFTWFLGGSHSNTQNDPGPGGFRQMRLDGAGNLFVRGSVNPGGADFAEMLPAESGLEAGDVLVIGADGRLTLSTKPYEDALAGVCSTKPGFLGGAGDGESLDGKVPLAVIGVVPVKVTDEAGPIAAGDALTSSSTPGHAMKAAKIRVGGVAFFPSGVVIGKALEALDSPVGMIRALVMLQ
jgi:hypothetical protein